MKGHGRSQWVVLEGSQAAPCSNGALSTLARWPGWKGRRPNTKRLQVWSLVQAHTGDNRSMFLSPPHPFLLSKKSINISSGEDL